MARPLSVVKGDAPKNAKEALASTETEHLECRDLRHPWSVIGLFYAQGAHGREVHRKLVCSRCGTEATDRWSPRGTRIARQYKYVTGYSHKGVRIKPIDVRKEVLGRVQVFDDEDTMLANLFSARRRKRA